MASIRRYPIGWFATPPTARFRARDSLIGELERRKKREGFGSVLMVSGGCYRDRMRISVVLDLIGTYVGRETVVRRCPITALAARHDRGGDGPTNDLLAVAFVLCTSRHGENMRLRAR
jgi:hypothetical protein